MLTYKNDPYAHTRQTMILAQSCLLHADHMNIHSLIQDHVKILQHEYS